MEYRGYDKNFSLVGKTALITGGGGGIGKAITSLFYEKGANLVLADFNPAIENVAQQMGVDPARVLPITADITKTDQREKIAEASMARFGAVDILVNNAGIGPLAKAVDFAETEWDRTLDLNLRAAFFLAQRLGAKMIERGRGKIVNIASQASVIALDRHVAYCASKAAMVAMTKVLALEWGPHNIQTNAVSPTVVLTELGKAAWDGEVGDAMKRKIPTGRFAVPEEVAACVLFLASDAAAMINGENLVIDGGYSIQ